MSGETMAQAFEQTAAHVADRVALRSIGGETSITWGEYAQKAYTVAAGLAALGIQRGDTVGLMLTNRPEFHWCDTGAMLLGATSFSIYNTSAPDQISYLLGDAGNKVMFCEQQFAERIRAADTPALETLVVVDGEGGDMTLDELIAGGDPSFDVSVVAAAVQPEDVLTLIYTSGTTGPPKGVQLTHGNLMSEVRAFEDWTPEREDGHRVVSYLPMAHIAERNVSHYFAIPHGMTVTSVPDQPSLGAALVDTRPTFFVGVPRVWEKLKAGLEGALPDELKAAIAAKQVPEDIAGMVRAKVGLDQVEVALTGAAPIPVEVLEFFDALGLPIVEVWGMSETSAVATSNPRDDIRIGTVGKAIRGVEVVLADDGEVLVRGPIIMKGYRNMPDKTAETIDADGWLHTGDIGQFDDDGYLKIVDRKKEIIINAAGKNMSPANIEARIKSSSALIGQAVCIGDARPYNTALIVLDPDGAGDRDPADPETVKLVQEGIDAANGQLSRVEQIKRFKILPGDWLPGGDELTPTMKLKRKPIAAKYAAEIEELYRA